MCVYSVKIQFFWLDWFFPTKKKNKLHNHALALKGWKRVIRYKNIIKWNLHMPKNNLYLILSKLGLSLYGDFKCWGTKLQTLTRKIPSLSLLYSILVISHGLHIFNRNYGIADLNPDLNRQVFWTTCFLIWPSNLPCVTSSLASAQNWTAFKG